MIHSVRSNLYFYLKLYLLFNLGRLYLNILWSKLIEIKKNSTKDLTFVCKLNPAMTEIKEGEFVMILFRFDNETERNDAYEKLDKERS